MIASAAPVAVVSVAGPVHVGLNDGYTTPETLLVAIGTGISAAGSAAVEIATHAPLAIGNWLTGDGGGEPHGQVGDVRVHSGPKSYNP